MPFDKNLDGCHLGAWVDGSYSVDGITCSSGKSRVTVFRHIDDTDVVTISARGKPFGMIGDKYKQESCRPLSFNGIQSVACEGEKTTLVYTPVFEPRMFDELDGNLMLGRLALNWGGKLWAFVKEGFRGGQAEKHFMHMVPEEMLAGWENGIREVQNLLVKWDGSLHEIDWATRQVQDCNELIRQVKLQELKTQPEVIEEITERIEALQEDVAEQFIYHEVGELFTQRKEAQTGRESNFFQADKHTGSSLSFNNAGPAFYPASGKTKLM